MIGDALALDIPVLVGVNGLNHEKFEAFTDNAAQALEPELDAIVDWVERVTAQRSAAA